MKKFTKKQVVLIVLMAVCTVLFVSMVWFLTDNLINQAFSALEEHPEIRNTTIKAIYLNISFQSVLALFYGLFLWLAISIIKHCRRHREEDS